jgi:hypothetical protein
MIHLVFIFKISETEKQSVLESLVEMGSSHAQVNSQSYYKVKSLDENSLFSFFSY